MENCEAFIHHILRTTNDDLLLKYWRQQLEQKPEENKEVLPVVSEKQLRNTLVEE